MNFQYIQDKNQSEKSVSVFNFCKSLFSQATPVFSCLLLHSLCYDTTSQVVSGNPHSKLISSVQSSHSVCPTLCDPMNCSKPGLSVHHQLPEFTQTHIHWVGDAIQPSHPLSSPSPPDPNPSQHQSLFQWVNSSHEVGKVLEFQL